jgi:hypothetical protein
MTQPPLNIHRIARTAEVSMAGMGMRDWQPDDRLSIVIPWAVAGQRNYGGDD